MNILIIGLGSIAKKHIRVLKELIPRANIWALRSNENESNTYLDVKNLYKIQDLKFDIDFSIITNPSHLHEEYILLMADKKIPFIVEKPSVISLNNASLIEDVLNKNEVINYVACNLRFHPCISFLKEYFKINRLKINEINIYCGSNLEEWRPGSNVKDSYSANAHMGGGVHLDLIHEIDYTLWIFGMPENFRVYKSSKSTLQINSVDYANYILEYPDFNVSIVLNYYRKTPKRNIEVLLEDDILKIDLLDCSVLSFENGVLFQQQSYDIMDTYRLQMKHFLNVMDGTETTMNDFSESLKSLRLAISDD